MTLWLCVVKFGTSLSDFGARTSPIFPQVSRLPSGLVGFVQTANPPNTQDSITSSAIILAMYKFNAVCPRLLLYAANHQHPQHIYFRQRRNQSRVGRNHPPLLRSVAQRMKWPLLSRND